MSTFHMLSLLSDLPVPVLLLLLFWIQTFLF